MTNQKNDPLAALVDVPLPEDGKPAITARQTTRERATSGHPTQAKTATREDRHDDDLEQPPVDVTHATPNVDSAQFAANKAAEARLTDLTTLVDSAVAFSDRWEELYRPEIFRAALEILRGDNGDAPVRRRVQEAQGSVRRVDTGERGAVNVESERAILGPTDKLARALTVTLSAVERTVHFEDSGAFQILGRIPGKAKKEQQTNCALAYLYIKEMALASRLVDIEELRQLCSDQGCYDQANFTANFKRDVDAGLLREQGAKNARARRYMLTQKGVAAGAQLLTELVQQ